jgi:hypothetical protein
LLWASTPIVLGNETTQPPLRPIASRNIWALSPGLGFISRALSSE